MAYVSANWGEEANLQTKSTTITPSAAWSSAYTGYSDIEPDSGYDGMEKVSVRTPMIRDNTLVTATSVEQPGTVYNGDYSQSTGSTKYLRVAPTKTGMAYTNSYLYLGGSSYMGNATTADVLSGKTFSSASGIELTGTATAGVDTSDATATANDILYPKTAYISDGSKATGTIQTLSASSETISEAKTYKAGYYPDGWTVTPSGGTDPSDATATADDITYRKTAYIKTGRVYGTRKPMWHLHEDNTFTSSGEVYTYFLESTSMELEMLSITIWQFASTSVVYSYCSPWNPSEALDTNFYQNTTRKALASTTNASAATTNNRMAIKKGDVNGKYGVQVGVYIPKFTAVHVIVEMTVVRDIRYM